MQLKLNDLVEAIATIGRVAGGLFFVALLIHSFFQPGTNNSQRYFDVSSLASEQMLSFSRRTLSEKGAAFVDILVISVTLVVVVAPEGKPHLLMLRS